jgi:hypothetical protein
MVELSAALTPGGGPWLGRGRSAGATTRICVWCQITHTATMDRKVPVGTDT